MKNKENTIFIIFVICISEIIFVSLGIIGYEIKQMIIDHKCYIREETREEICRRYR